VDGDKAFDAIVIGGGIIGLSCGYYLSREGKRVLVLEKGEPGCGASGSCDDMILFQSKKPGVLLEMTFLSRDLYRTLEAELDMKVEFQNLGGMILIENEAHLAIMEDFVTRQRACGLSVEMLDRREALRRQPCAGPSIVASTYCPDDSQANPFKVMAAFRAAGERKGMRLRKRAAVTATCPLPGGGWEVATETERYRADLVVNAAGAWAAQLAAQIGLELPIVPRRGQILVTEAVGLPGETNVWSSEYIVSKLRPDMAGRDERSRRLGLGFAFSRTWHGNYLIGSTRENVGFDKRTTGEALDAVAAKAVELFPVLGQVHVVRSFSGLRPACVDGKCILGESPRHPGYFIAAGHEGDGIALAPVTGKFLADLVCGRRTELDLTELHPGRFCDAKVA
jgi:sarcosine oxidase subunit beta